MKLKLNQVQIIMLCGIGVLLSLLGVYYVNLEQDVQEIIEERIVSVTILNNVSDNLSYNVDFLQNEEMLFNLQVGKFYSQDIHTLSYNSSIFTLLKLNNTLIVEHDNTLDNVSFVITTRQDEKVLNFSEFKKLN